MEAVTARPRGRRPARRQRIPAAFARRFEAAIFDWDAVVEQAEDVGKLVERLCAAGFELALLSRAALADVDGRLRARPAGPGRLHLCVSGGSEIFAVERDGSRLVERRVATAEEDAALSSAAERVVAALAERGLRAEVSQQPNRRMIDIVPGAADEKVWIGKLAAVAARDAGIAHPRVTSDGKQVEIGLTDKASSAEWFFDELWRRGISPAATLVPVDARTPLAHLLEDQLERRERGELPLLVDDPAWTIAVDGVSPAPERVNESLLTLADGRLGTRGSPIDGHPSTAPGVVAAGAYHGHGPEEELTPLPLWQRLSFELRSRDRVRRVLDLRTGLLRQDVRGGRRRASAVLLSSLAEPGTVALRAELSRRLAKDGAPLTDGGEVRTLGSYAWARRPAGTGGVLALARDWWTHRRGDLARLDRLAVFAVDPDEPPAPAEAARRLRAAAAQGFDGVLSEHRAAWAGRWEQAGISIEGDPELERAVRFCLFQLMASVDDRGEAALGARGLSGSAYRGHVFWDSDVFGLPFFAATHPPAARALLEYRLRRLPAAHEIARAFGRSGARFPWESARTGVDVTPTEARDASGTLIPILTGEREEHIVADVAWAASSYVDWTGDQEFLHGHGWRLLIETARYWASRVRLDEHGRGHIEGVIGPDEYHEDVDDNAYTNVMARWNLRRGAAAAAVSADERDAWLRTADSLVDGYDPASGLYEQFAGFFALEPIVIADLAPRRPIAGDLLLGRERVAGAQVVKQADVLMLHHLVPDEVAAGSLEPNLAFYEPRTAHGSSLSPAVHATLLARAGRLDEAVAWLRVAAHIDLDDATGTTAGGLHMATMGGVWQALAFGFAGLSPRGAVLELDPHLPDQWSALELRIRFRGVATRIRITRDDVVVDAAAPLQVAFRGRTYGPAALHRLDSREESWEGAQR